MYNNFRRFPYPQSGNRFIGGGFLAPFLLGGITGGLLAPAFYPRPYPIPYGPIMYSTPYPVQYNTYSTYY